MGQVIRTDNIATLQKDSSTELSLAASVITIAGQQYKTTSNIVLDVTASGFGGLDTGSLTASTEYYVYAVTLSNVVGLVASLSSSGPSGFVAYTEVGGMFTDGGSDIFPTAVTDDGFKVGTIKQSMLTEAQFRQENGLGWILMDGRSVAGSRYNTLTGNSSVPDARGVALRSKNNGRSDGNQNPDGDLALGTFQNHQHMSHNHGGGSHNHGSGIGSDAGHADPYGFKPGAPTGTFRYSGTTSGAKPMPYTETVANISSDGGNETRMRNITVNTFVKVN